MVMNLQARRDDEPGFNWQFTSIMVASLPGRIFITTCFHFRAASL